jgi:hypothetical protein
VSPIPDPLYLRIFKSPGIEIWTPGSAATKPKMDIFYLFVLKISGIKGQTACGRDISTESHI